MPGLSDSFLWKSPILERAITPPAILRRAMRKVKGLTRMPEVVKERRYLEHLAIAGVEAR